MASGLVAIVGRPNVGKSTFFNKMAGRRISIVEDTPGVTRDRVYADVEWQGRAFTLIDTGGIDLKSEDVLLKQMLHQAQIAIDTADVILFFVDAREGLTHDDRDVADMLRRTHKPVRVVVNKLDYLGLEPTLYEYYELGMGDPIGISSTNMLGLGDLLDEVTRLLPPETIQDDDAQRPVNLAVVGRPNVGKSSLVNRLLGTERTMVSDIPGTTRDAVDARLTGPDGTAYILVDTAGIRRKSAIEDESLEWYSVLRSIAAIQRCDVALLLIDAQDGVTEQDTKIAGIIKDEGKAAVVIVNKWDAVEKSTGTLEEYRRKIQDDLNFMDYAPILFISALTGKRAQTVLEAADKAWAQTSRRVPTGALNDVLGDAQMTMQPPMSGGRRLKIYYGTQQAVCPPTIILFINDTKLMHFSYQRYLENHLRKSFGFEGTPIRIVLREKTKGEQHGMA